MKHLCIDIGNVICHVNFDNFCVKFNKRNHMINNLDGFEFLINIQKENDLGFSGIEDELNELFTTQFAPIRTEIVNDLVDEWNKTVVPNPIMISWLSDLIYKEDVAVALLSNIGLDHSALMREILTPAIFDHSIKFFSHEVGARKPTFVYYNTFLNMYPNFKESCYIDDREENLETGKLFGLKSLSFKLDDFKSDDELKHSIKNIKEEWIK